VVRPSRPHTHHQAGRKRSAHAFQFTDRR
jgi:hypothetical protein